MATKDGKKPTAKPKGTKKEKAIKPKAGKQVAKAAQTTEPVKFSVGVSADGNLVAQFPKGFVFHNTIKATRDIEFFVYRCMLHVHEKRDKIKEGLTPSRSSIDDNATIIDLVTPWIPLLEENWSGQDKGLGQFEAESRDQIRGSKNNDTKKHLRFHFWQLYIYLGDIRDHNKATNDHTIAGVWERVPKDIETAYPLYPPTVVGP
jgi:hypothetical protein